MLSDCRFTICGRRERFTAGGERAGDGAAEGGWRDAEFAAACESGALGDPRRALLLMDVGSTDLLRNDSLPNVVACCNSQWPRVFALMSHDIVHLQ